MCNKPRGKKERLSKVSLFCSSVTIKQEGEKKNPETVVGTTSLAPVCSSSAGCLRTFGVAGAGSRGRRRGRGRGRHRGTEAVGGDPQRGHVFLRLEQDDVNLGSKEAAEHHRAAQTDGDAHGGGLHLERDDDNRGA